MNVFRRSGLAPFNLIASILIFSIFLPASQEEISEKEKKTEAHYRRDHRRG